MVPLNQLRRELTVTLFAKSREVVGLFKRRKGF